MGKALRILRLFIVSCVSVATWTKRRQSMSVTFQICAEGGPRHGSWRAMKPELPWQPPCRPKTYPVSVGRLPTWIHCKMPCRVLPLHVSEKLSEVVQGSERAVRCPPFRAEEQRTSLSLSPLHFVLPFKVKKRDAEADARAYLDTHRLHEARWQDSARWPFPVFELLALVTGQFMHGLFELLLRERPEDPYSFMALCPAVPRQK